MPRVIAAFTQFFDGEGVPLSGGKLRFTESGTTSTDKDTFYDVSEETPNTNPVVLDADGRCPNVFGSGSYRATLYDTDDQQIAQFDPVPGDIAATTQMGNYLSTTVYPIDWVVFDDEGDMYKSLQNDNGGNTPAASPAWWEKVDFTQTWNAYVNYDVDNLVYGSDNKLYKASVANGPLYEASYGVVDPVGDDTGVWTRPGTNLVEFTADGDYEKPLGLAYVIVEGVGGGGGSGATGATTATTRASSVGGGGGGYFKLKILAEDLPELVSVTVGAAGLGGDGTGGDGGTTSFGAIATALGGSGGQSCAASTERFRYGSSGGGATGGDLVIRGGNSGATSIYDSVIFDASDGGDSQMGTGGLGGTVTGPQGYGSGGQGVHASLESSAIDGYDGAPGKLIITEYYGI